MVESTTSGDNHTGGTERWHHFTGVRLGPHQIPLIECGKCGHEHHIDSATGEYQGRCTNCYGFLRRPTEAEQQQFTEFYVWNSEWYIGTGSDRDV